MKKTKPKTKVAKSPPAAPTMKPLDLLKAADKLLATEKQWTHGAFARNAQDRVVDLLSEEAVAWDLMGAVRRAAGIGSDHGSGKPYNTPEYIAAYNLLREHAKPRDVFVTNDKDGFAGVKRLLKKTIDGGKK